MTIIRAQVRIHVNDALPENDVTNTFYFDGSGNVPVLAHNLLETFYGEAQNLLSETVSDGFDVKYYDMSDEEPRTPVLEDTLDVTVGDFDTLPHQLAVCMSFSGEAAGVPIARRRGRIFLGPLNRSVLLETGGNVFLSDAYRNMLAGAGAALMNSGDASCHWAIYSPTTHKGRGPTSGGRPGGAGPLPALEPESLENSTHDVRKVWVDNRFDIIRSRAPKATARTTAEHI